MPDFSKAITKSRVIALTGAGSTAALGLRVMATFVDLLDSEVEEAAQGKSDIFRQVYEQMTRIPQGRDLEKILDRLERYADVCEFISEDQNMSRFFKSGRDGFHPIVLELDALVRDLIFDHYSQVDADQAYEIFDPFLELLAKANPEINGGYTVPYFTTNYDSAIERTVEKNMQKYSLRDGFRERPAQQVWDPRTIEEYPGYSDKTTIWLFKLHGSVYWYEPEGTGRVMTFPSTVGPKPQGHRPVLLYPTESAKEFYPLGEPFDTMYAVLKECMLHAEFVVVVGYSFRDPVLRDLVKAIDEKDRPTFIVIRPGMKNESEHERVREQLGVNVLPLPYRFGQKDEHEKILAELKKLIR